MRHVASWAGTTDTALVLVDVGAQSAPLPPQAGFVSAKIRHGTRNLARAPALAAEELDQAWEIGGERTQVLVFCTSTARLNPSRKPAGLLWISVFRTSLRNKDGLPGGIPGLYTTAGALKIRFQLSAPRHAPL